GWHRGRRIRRLGAGSRLDTFSGATTSACRAKLQSWLARSSLAAHTRLTDPALRSQLSDRGLRLAVPGSTRNRYLPTHGPGPVPVARPPHHGPAHPRAATLERRSRPGGRGWRGSGHDEEAPLPLPPAGSR